MNVFIALKGTHFLFLFFNILYIITYNRSNGTEANCPVPNGQGPLCMTERLIRAELPRAFLSQPSFPNTKCWKNISRDAAHVVILRVTRSCFVKRCTDYRENKLTLLIFLLYKT